MLRCILPSILIGAAFGLHAQDWDVYVRGTITDAETGAAIPFAVVNATDALSAGYIGQTQAGERGNYVREQYSGWVAPGGRYVLTFTADGYRPRAAMVDVSEVKKADPSTAWDIKLDVVLEKGSPSEPGAPLGNCRWHEASGTLKWDEGRAQKQYPIRAYIDERIGLHASAVDSVHALPGLMLDGNVVDHWADTPIAGAAIHVTSIPPDSAWERQHITDRYGYYVMSLPYGKVYALEFSGAGRVNKNVVVDTRPLLDLAPSTSGFRAVLDIRLFEVIADQDFAFLNQPIGRMVYEKATNEMVWDMAYSRPILERLNKILDKYGPR